MSLTIIGTSYYKMPFNTQSGKRDKTDHIEEYISIYSHGPYRIYTPI